MKPFRFGIENSKLPSKTWRDDLKFIEDVGYSSILWTDHFGPQWEPTAAMASTAAVTTKLKTGTMGILCLFPSPSGTGKSLSDSPITIQWKNRVRHRSRMAKSRLSSSGHPL